MRRQTVLLLCAAVPLLLVAPPVVAAERKADEQGSLSEPDAHSRYEVDPLTVRVPLPVSGCASREDRSFDLSIRVVQMDNHGGRDVTQRITTGPSGPATRAMVLRRGRPVTSPSPPSASKRSGVGWPRR